MDAMNDCNFPEWVLPALWAFNLGLLIALGILAVLIWRIRR
jgi:hypothetical protein